MITLFEHAIIILSNPTNDTYLYKNVLNKLQVNESYIQKKNINAFNVYIHFPNNVILVKPLSDNIKLLNNTPHTNIKFKKPEIKNSKVIHKCVKTFLNYELLDFSLQLYPDNIHRYI